MRLVPILGSMSLLCMSAALSQQEVWSEPPHGGPLHNDAEIAAGVVTSELAQSQTKTQGVKIYVGCGCFWAVQKHIASVEESVFGRAPEAVTALAGYAGSSRVGPHGLVCYHHGGEAGALYETLGHAEAIQVTLDANDTPQQLTAILNKFFSREFQQTPQGMMRTDPQDAGSAYRSMIGLPGGVNSPLMQQVNAANVNGMAIKPGQGSDSDEINVIWIYDTHQYPFHRAERYHQFWDGPPGVKLAQERKGRINPTGCSEKYPAEFKTHDGD